MEIMASGPITSWQIDGETMETITDFIFLGSKILADDDCSHEIQRCLLLGRKAMTNLDSILKSRDITLLTNVIKPFLSSVQFSSVQFSSYDVSSSHVWTWELDHKESWAPKNWCFWTVVLEKTLESPLDCKEIKPVNPKGNQSWILEGLMLKLKLKYFGHLVQRTDSLEKTLMLGKPEGRRRRGEKDEMVGWHHHLNGHEFEKALWIGDRQERLACCSPWGHKESDTTEWLNWTETVYKQ